MKYTRDELTINYLEQNLSEDFKNLQKREQFQGRNFNPITWQKRLLSGERFGNVTCSSPENIISFFRNDQFLSALALIVSWGTMARTQRFIYREELDKISSNLRQCKKSIERTNSIEESWHRLSSELGWSPVIISKTLHFLSRSLGFEKDAPVPLDNGVMIHNVWPIAFAEHQKQYRWVSKDDGWEGYCRYMTFIEYLRDKYYPDWSNTNVENALFERFR